MKRQVPDNSCASAALVTPRPGANSNGVSYGIIGNGRAARHLMHYFELLSVPYAQWHRGQSPSKLQKFKQLFQKQVDPLSALVNASSHVVLLLPDDQIEAFVERHPQLKTKTLIHFSGVKQVAGVVGCHPLMTFGPELYTLETYRNMPFVVDAGASFAQLFPALPNPNHTIQAEHKALYHAHCVIAGNVTQMLWREIGQQLQNDMDLPADLMHAYLLQNTLNYLANPEQAATGPFVRGDLGTIERHAEALKHNALAPIHQAIREWQLPQNNESERQQS